MTQAFSRPAQTAARLTRRLERSDPFLMRAVQVATLAGCILGILIYAWLSVSGENAASRRALAGAAAAGQVAAEAELSRIQSVALSAAPLVAAANAADTSAAERVAINAALTRLLATSPVTAIVVFTPDGHSAGIFGEMPSDAAGRISPPSTSRRAGQELLGLELVPVSERRAAYYLPLPTPDGRILSAAMVLRSGAFQSALNAGAASGPGWRAALLNRDGQAVLTAATAAAPFAESDSQFAAAALGWRPLHADESSAAARSEGQHTGAFIETRTVADDMLQIAYVGTPRSAVSVLIARRYEFAALLGAALLALTLAISIIQNEWQRYDLKVRDADLLAARAEVTCDLLAAGVIDWSVADGRVDYSEGWADMFAQGAEPTSEEIFDWIARIHPDDRLAARDAYQAMLDGRETELVHRMRIRMSSGLWVQVVERGRAILGPEGQTRRIVLIQTTEPADGSALRHAFIGAAAKPAEAIAG
ncbi:PAS domain-containing protein [Hyphomonas sp.]|uniref:PAS domain-containing protein n=1 Tax=Hyphomonas sp. TaxID=87 RepID=UPI0025C35A91|nr:PAS domain-containing protein [Hyphomonas sp.]MBI1400037.1 PAS domain-containing protein [Hyphomonas sp.]